MSIGRIHTKDLSRTEVCFVKSRHRNINEQCCKGLKSTYIVQHIVYGKYSTYSYYDNSLALVLKYLLIKKYHRSYVTQLAVFLTFFGFVLRVTCKMTKVYLLHKIGLEWTGLTEKSEKRLTKNTQGSNGVITRFQVARNFSHSTSASCEHVFDHCDWPKLDLEIT